MIISFSGLDGSGKTTQADHAVGYLEEKGFPCGKRHAVKGTLAYFINHKIVGKVSPSSKKGFEEGLRDKQNTEKHSFLSAVKRFFMLLDMVYFRLRYASYKGSKSKTLICDRYFYDENVQGAYLETRHSFYNRLYKKMLIKPDLAFFFKTDPEKAYTRKTEYDFTYFSVKNGLYEVLAQEGVFTVIPEDNIDGVWGKVAGSLDELYGFGGRS